MHIDAIKNGIVIDHISAGRAMQIYDMLSLDKLDCPVAILKNVPSKKMGRKDIIKIDCDLQIDLNVLGYVSPSITVVYVRDGVVAEKKHIGLPERLTDIIRCKNPRCITVSESQLDAIFLLSDPAKHTYRCAYCETAIDKKF